MGMANFFLVFLNAKQGDVEVDGSKWGGGGSGTPWGKNKLIVNSWN